MWGDLRVDVWFYGILLSDLLATLLFFKKHKKWNILYITVLASPALWIVYENKIIEYLSMSVPIRLDFPIVAFLALYPIIPSVVHGKRLKSESSRKTRVDPDDADNPCNPPRNSKNQLDD
jgi:hypothetical protein